MNTLIDGITVQIDGRLKELAEEQARLETARGILLNGTSEPARNGNKASAARGATAPAVSKRGGRRRPSKRGEIPAAIIGLLGDGTVRTPSMLAEELGRTPQQVSNAITGIKSDGRIARGTTESGKPGWTLPQTA